MAAKDKHDEGRRGHRKHGQHGHGSEEPHEGAPEWLISFADNVLLQMGFFVILLAMNMAVPRSGGAAGDGDGGKAREEAMLDFAIAVRQSFNNPVDLGSRRPEDAPLIQRINERKRREAGEGGPAGYEQEPQTLRPTGYSSLGGTVLFVDHSPSLGADQQRRAVDIAKKVAGLRWVVEVRGHVSAAESFREGSRGFKLSHERAMAVATVLAESGVDWRQIRIVACGDTDPVHIRAYEPGEQRSNQRVDIVVTDQMTNGER
jgi:flagellar motor protein MotB